MRKFIVPPDGENSVRVPVDCVKENFIYCS
jgi:hypothetical protein